MDQILAQDAHGRVDGRESVLGKRAGSCDKAQQKLPEVPYQRKREDRIASSHSAETFARARSRKMARVFNFWIVDTGTKPVYQSDFAADRTSGSQSPSTIFERNAGCGQLGESDRLNCSARPVLVQLRQSGLFLTDQIIGQALAMVGE
jgi:hypothetical protein